MLGLLFMAPELGELVIDGLTRKVVSVAIDELGSSIATSGAGLLGGFNKTLGLAASDLTGALTDGVQTRLRAGVLDTLTTAGVVIMASAEAELLLKVADAAERGGNVSEAVAELRAWRAANPRASAVKA